MKDFIKGWRSVCLGFLSGAGMGAAAFFAIEASMPLLGHAQWLNEAGGNIYGDSRYNIDADPRYNIDADPRYNIDADPRYNINADPRYNICADPRYSINGCR